MYTRIAFNGMVLGVCIAFVVLAIATQNLFVSFVATITIICAIICVIGCTVLIGWRLGSYESQYIMILSGFSVDYVVHLAHAYMEAPAPFDRLQRAREGLKTIGASVFWGMATSVGACIALSLCRLQFFTKFGIFFMLTVLWSYLWGVFFMMPLLAFCGPAAIKPVEVSSDTSKRVV